MSQESINLFHKLFVPLQLSCMFYRVYKFLCRTMCIWFIIYSFLNIYFYLFIYVSVYVWVLTGTRRRHRLSWKQSYRWLWATSCGYWNLYSSPFTMICNSYRHCVHFIFEIERWNWREDRCFWFMVWDGTVHRSEQRGGGGTHGGVHGGSQLWQWEQEVACMQFRESEIWEVGWEAGEGYD